MKYQNKYGKRGSESWERWVLRKRTINIAYMVVSCVAGNDFSDFELALYFRCDEPKVKYFLRAYEGQMEDAVINPEKFVANLDSFYLTTCLYIEKNHLFREFFDFSELLEQQRRFKIRQGHKKIFDAYLSLIMQQTCYFCRNRMEDSVSGITESGDLIFCKNPDPYSDIGSYTLEKYYAAYLSGEADLTEKQLYTAYKPYGYDIHSMNDVNELEARAKIYDNNNYIMIPYISEKNQDILLQEPYQHRLPNFPRQWKKTDFYLEKLKHRNYMLPSAGITAYFANAGDIQEILFFEIFHNDEIVLLYRVSTYCNGQYSGYFHTKNQTFYSIFEYSNRPQWHELIKNFILENYMILTCDYEIDRKKNYAIKESENLDTDFHFPHQPLVSYVYKQGSSYNNDKQKTRRYVKEEYQEELRTRSGYIRSLPVNQHASEEAIQYAAELGLDLPAGKTFVRSHEFHVYRKITAISTQV